MPDMNSVYESLVSYKVRNSKTSIAYRNLEYFTFQCQ